MKTISSQIGKRARKPKTTRERSKNILLFGLSLKRKKGNYFIGTHTRIDDGKDERNGYFFQNDKNVQ